MSRFISAGFGEDVDAEKVVALLQPDSAPIRRKIQEAKESGLLIDATYGRKVRTVLFMQNGAIMICGIATETMAERLNNSGANV